MDLPITVGQYIKTELIKLGYISGDIYIDKFNLFLSGEDDLAIAIKYFNGFTEVVITPSGERTEIHTGLYNVFVRLGEQGNDNDPILDKLYRDLNKIDGNSENIPICYMVKKFMPYTTNESNKVIYSGTIRVVETIK